MSDVREGLLSDSPWKLMMKLSLPAILGQFVVGLYPFVDSIFVGQMIGVDALAAVSAASPFILINNGIAVLVGMGSGSLLSRAIGANDRKTVDAVMGNLAVLVLALSALVMIAGTAFAPLFLQLAGAEGAVLDQGAAYLRTVFLGSAFVNFMQSANMLMRAEGRMSTAMLIMASGAVLNIVLDPILILALPGYGVAAVAVATVVSQFAQAALTLVYFLKFSPVVRFTGFRLAPALLPQILSVGFSGMLMQVLMLVQMTVLYHTAVRYGGADQIALMGAAQRVLQLAFVPIWGMSQGLQPAVGTNFGAGLNRRVKKVANTFIVASTVLAFAFWAILQILAPQILGAFITDPALVARGIGDFRIMFVLFPTYGLMIMAFTFFQALGKAAIASVLVIMRQIVLIVPLVLLLPAMFGVTGVWAAIPVNDGIVLVLALFMMARAYRSLGNDDRTAGRADSSAVASEA